MLRIPAYPGKYYKLMFVFIKYCLAHKFSCINLRQFLKMTKATLYKKYHCVSAVFMIIALLWLTISAPFAFENQKKFADHSKYSSTQSPFAGSEEESNSTGGNTTEEKTPKSLSIFSEEYLHSNQSQHTSLMNLQYFKNQDAGIYVAYHGEPLVPPPNAA
jgi:uncharacterized protein Usg